MANFVEGDNISDYLNPLTRGIGRLGDIKFVSSSWEVRTPDDFKRTSKARYAQHDLLGLEPRLEYLGPDLERISFRMKLLKQLGGNIELEAYRLRNLAKGEKVVPLVIGAEVIGRFIVEEVTEALQIVNGRGDCLVAEFDVTLKQVA